MNKRNAIFATFCVTAVIAVWNSRNSEPTESTNSVRAEPEQNDALQRKAEHVSEPRSNHAHKQQEMSILRAKMASLLPNADDESSPMLSLGEPTLDKAALEEANERENEKIAEENSEKQLFWRNAWIDEAQDDRWTRLMEEEIDNKILSTSKRDVEVRHISCRETVCRMFLQFADDNDAEAFISQEHDDPHLQYEYKLLNPHTGFESPKELKYNYELMVKRERPSYLPPRNQQAPSRTKDNSISEASETEG